MLELTDGMRAVLRAAWWADRNAERTVGMTAFEAAMLLGCDEGYCDGNAVG